MHRKRITHFEAFCAPPIPRHVAAVLVLLLVLAFAPTKALAIDINGMDYLYGSYVNTSEEGVDQVDLLAIQDSKNQTVYVDITDTNGNKVITDMPFDLNTDVEGDSEQGGTYIGALRADFTEGFQSDHTYIIELYTDHGRKDCVYRGSIYTVFARCADADGNVTDEPIAVRTLACDADGNVTETRAMTPPPYVTVGSGTSYAIVKSGDKAPAEPSVDANGLHYFDYKLSEDTPETVNGSITFMSNDGRILQTVAIPNVGSEGVFELIPSIISVENDGKTEQWRPLCLNGMVIAKHPGISDFVIYCKPLAAEDEQFTYLANIHLQAADDTELATDQVVVADAFSYAAPLKMHIKDEKGLWTTYTRSSASPTELDEDGILTLASAQEVSHVQDGVADYYITYEPLDTDNSREFTVIRMNGAVGGELDRETLVCSPSTPAIYTVEKEVEADGQTLVPIAQTPDSYTFEYDAKVLPIQRVYYVPKDYKPAGPTTVTIRYADVATGKEIQSHTEQVSAQSPEGSFEFPESFTAGGKTYVLLAGQKSPIRHNYYSTTKTYTVWYRDKNDASSANTTVSQVAVQNTSSTAQSTSSTATTTAQSASAGAKNSNEGATATDTNASDAVPAAIPESEGLNRVTSTTGSTIVDGEGRDAETARTYAAAERAEEAAQQATVAASNNTAVIGIGVALLAAAGGLIAFFMKRNKESGPDDDVMA